MNGDNTRENTGPSDGAKEIKPVSGTPQFEDDTVQALLAKAREEAQKRARITEQSGGVMPNVVPGVRTQIREEAPGAKIASPAEPEPQTIVIESEEVKEPQPKAPLVAAQTPPPPSVQEIPSIPTESPVAAEPAYKSPLKNLRTYQGDVAEALKDSNASMLSISLAARKKKEKEPPPTQTPIERKREKKNTMLALSSALLLVIGLSILGSLYYVHVQNLPVPVIEPPRSIISFDRETEILSNGLTKEKFLSVVEDIKNDPKEKNKPASSITYLHIVKRASTTPTIIVTDSINGSEFLSLLKSRAPISLTRSFVSSFMLGLYRGRNNDAFILIELSSYENAFDGMLSWEKNMWGDIGALMSPKIISVVSAPNAPLATTTASTTAVATTTPGTVATTTATTTPIVPLVPVISVKESFIDKVISNKDTRVLSTSFGETVLVYGFVTKDLLLIASSEETFKAILDRAFAAEAQ